MEQQPLTFMRMAVSAAEMAAARGEVPVGAVLVDSAGQVLALAGNQTEKQNDPTAHAEMLVIREAAQKIGAPRLAACDLYVTLEPCAMCAAAISFARIRRLYFGAYDVKGGAVDHGPRFFASPACHHAPDVFGGIMEQEARIMLQEFFQRQRIAARETI